MNRIAKNIGVYIIILALVMGITWVYQGSQGNQIKEVEFSEFVTLVQKNEVKQLTIIESKLTGTLRSGEKVNTYAPTAVELMLLSEKYVFPQMEAGTLVLTSEKPSSSSWIISLLPTVVMVMIFIVFFFVFMQQGQGGGKGVMAFGRSRAKLHKEDEQRKVTFNEVAGLDEEKEELAEVVDFLKFPKKYRNLGARIPKGILLVGPPGTGKTYISKATAGEAGVPFFTISGSDFVEMFVGVGASRVRDLFEQAKKNSPCIVFIDEIDAVGRKRGAGLGGGHDEREQTLNQLLVEMDGFADNSGIIILAATNRPDILDPALLRPGRFDRQIVIGVPDIKGREAIFKIHSRNKPLQEDVDPKVLARRTPGFTPADIENMLNEAALLTARRSGKVIRMDEIEEAITKVIAGPEKKSRVISDAERKLTAYHEAGHALVARLLPNTDPIHQITIIPRGLAGGFTMILPKEDKYFQTKTEMQERIIHLLGGRVAEKLTLHDISTGASNDIERATEIAKAMVTKYGMSERLGPVNYSSSDEVFLGKDFSTRKNYSEEMAKEIDEEVRNIIEEAFQRAEKLLSDNIDKLHLVAGVLLEIETLDASQFEKLFTGEKSAEELIADTEEHAKNIQVNNAKEAAEHLAELEDNDELDYDDIDDDDENDDIEYEDDDIEDEDVDYEDDDDYEYESDRDCDDNDPED